MARGCFALCTLLACGATAQQQTMVALQVSGNQRLPSTAIIAASELRLGQPFSRKDLDTAIQKLFDTGLFSDVNYRYDPKTVGGVAGYVVTLRVTEEAAQRPVILDIPGVEEQHLWQDLMAADGLIGRRMPDNDRAPVYYSHAIEAVLRRAGHPQAITSNTEANLHTGAEVAIFRPVNLPKIVALRFEGNDSVPAAVLESALTKVAIGQSYSERDFRRLVELNLRPIYEERARLTVAFPGIRADGAEAGAVSVTTQIKEGPLWSLGKVDLVGDALPVAEMQQAARFATGKPANWNELLMAIERMKPVLARDGYLAFHAEPARSFHEDTQIVDVTVKAAKGRQYFFGELQINGLEPALQKQALGMWKLRAGAPMNTPYVGEYLHELLPYLKGKVKSVNTVYPPRTGTNVVDVTIIFR